MQIKKFPCALHALITKPPHFENRVYAHAPIAVLQGTLQNMTIETPAITAIQFSNETKNCIMHNAYAPAFIPY